MKRLRHPSADCPCQGCWLRFRTGVTTHPMRRSWNAAATLTPGDSPAELREPLTDLLDMPTPDRAVLIEVIRGLPPLAQENSPC